jgi:hypothetical protein
MAPTPAPIPVGIAAAATAALMLLAPSFAAASEASARMAPPGTALAALAAPRVPHIAAATGAGASRWGAVYAAEGIGFRLGAGHATREAARRAAETRCRDEASATCHPVGAFAGSCGAVAQAMDRSVLFAAARPLTPAPRASASLGAGATEEEASRAALRTCTAQPGASGRLCLVVAAACGPR